jgi:exodeoxyribonuclease VII large subunit
MQDLLEAPEGRAITVSELVAHLREALFDEFGELWVEGEIASLHRSRAGHLYFDLKDPDAQLRSVIFRRSASELPFEPEEGMQVLAHARLDVYPERGLLQLIVAQLKPYGEGTLRLAFERMKARLAAEGLFDPEHKQPLPFLPRRIGLVTSLQGAAIHDFLRGLRLRFAAVEVLLYDARVQGEGAWRELVRGLHLLDAQPGVDVIVVARGGGSIEDLWNFNREEVVRAIFELDTPVISAIGHEVDWVLSDLVADARAATPTTAAELVVPDGAALLGQVDGFEQRLVQCQRMRLQSLWHRLEGLSRGLVHPAQRLAELRRRLEGERARLLQAVDRRCERQATRLGYLRERFGRSIRGLQERRSARVEALAGRLDALSPLAVLGRGYSIARRESDGAILKSSRQVGIGEAIGLRLARGHLRAAVTERVED